MAKGLRSVGLLVLAWAADAIACTCAPPPPPAEAMNRAIAVFTAHVRYVTTEAQGQVKRVALWVRTGWKGVDQRFLTVRTPRDGAQCGFPFHGNRSYLIYADRDSSTGKLTVSLCSRTKPMSVAAEEIQLLGEPNYEPFPLED